MRTARWRRSHRWRREEIHAGSTRSRLLSLLTTPIRGSAQAQETSYVWDRREYRRGPFRSLFSTRKLVWCLHGLLCLGVPRNISRFFRLCVLLFYLLKYRQVLVG